MTLSQLLEHLHSLDDELTIYASNDPKWNADSEAVACLEPDDTTPTIEMNGLKLVYFLEVNIAKEVVGVWQAWRDGRVPSVPEMVEAIIYYAELDAYMPV